MEIIVLSAIVVITTVFVILPFFTRSADAGNTIEQKGPAENPLSVELKKLLSEKESLYTALNDIEFDYGLGKLSRQDYDELNQDYRARAVSVLKRIDEISSGLNARGIEDELEKQIIVMRRSKSSEEDEIEEEILRARKQKIEKAENLNCLNCGKQYISGDMFCSRCGIGLQDVS